MSIVGPLPGPAHITVTNRDFPRKSVVANIGGTTKTLGTSRTVLFADCSLHYQHVLALELPASALVTCTRGMWIASVESMLISSSNNLCCAASWGGPA